jgi:hypothetical protein
MLLEPLVGKRQIEITDQGRREPMSDLLLQLEDVFAPILWPTLLLPFPVFGEKTSTHLRVSWAFRSSAISTVS